MHQRFPLLLARRALRGRLLRIVCVPGDQQTLDRSTGRDAPADQPRRKDAGVVHDEHVAFAEERRQISNRPVIDSPRVPAQQQQATGAAFGSRFLGDEAGRQMEIEVANVHGLVEERSSGQSMGESRPDPAGSGSQAKTERGRLASGAVATRRAECSTGPDREIRRNGGTSGAAHLPAPRQSFGVRRCPGRCGQPHAPPAGARRSVPKPNSTTSCAPSTKAPLPQCSEARANPHSDTPKSPSSDRTWNRPTAASNPRGTIPKQTW